ncbi:MAG: flagellin [Selenomonadaceae bacterium]|nr:flagellin [Selenomonadaceae bacterium]
MSLTIHGNLARGAEGLTTTMNKHQTEMGKSLERVSTGQKINHAGDNSAGNAISEKMLAQIRALDQGQENTQNADSLLKIAEEAVNSIIDVVKAMRTKALEAANDSLNQDDRAVLQKEIDQLRNQVTSSALITHNGRHLFTGDYGAIEEAVYYDDNGDINTATRLSFSDISWKNDDANKHMYFQVGPDKGDTIMTNFMNMTDKFLFSDVTIDLSTVDKSEETAMSLDKALERALYQQAEIGVIRERLEYTSENLQMSSDENTAALSVIKDADMAKEMTNYVKNNVLMQATQAMMAQANTSLATFIDLIKGSIIS